MANLLYIVGPTASGKTDLAIDIARGGKHQKAVNQARSAEIISADSIQFYRELVIGSARPSQKQLSEVKHHLIGHISVADDYTAGAFEKEAAAIIDENPKTPFIICGGSGFYIQALQSGMYPIQKADPEIQGEIEKWIDQVGLNAAYLELVRLDEDAAAKISKNDRYRIVRSLEVLRKLGGENLSRLKARFAQNQKSRFAPRKVKTLVVQLEKEVLKKRVQLRTHQMLGVGLLHEVVDLIDMGYADRPALQSVGYKETLDLLLKDRDPSQARIAELENEIIQGTLRLAKKQRTWFNRTTTDIDTVRMDLSSNGKREQLVQELSGFLYEDSL